jgi:hypothetical protein
MAGMAASRVSVASTQYSNACSSIEGIIPPIAPYPLRRCIDGNVLLIFFPKHKFYFTDFKECKLIFLYCASFFVCVLSVYLLSMFALIFPAFSLLGFTCFLMYKKKKSL